MKNEISSTVIRFFKSNNLKFDEYDEHHFICKMSMENSKVKVFIEVKEETNILTMTCLSQLKMKQSQREEVLFLLNNINSKLNFGRFYLDSENDIIFSNSIRCINGIQINEVSSIFHIACITFDDMYPDIAAKSLGFINPSLSDEFCILN